MAESQVRRKVLRRFYEPLLLLNSLGQIRGERIRSKPSTDALDPSIHKLRRCFLDGIAYICSYEKSPTRVTAVALEKTPQGITVWLAANEKLGNGVIEFLESILSDVQRISALSTSDLRQREGERIEEDLASRIIAFNKSRVQTYYKVAQKRVPKCLDIITKSHENSGNRNGETNLVEWLREHFVTGTVSTLTDKELQALVRTCHRNRRSPTFDTLKRLAGQGETCRAEFEQLYELLCKLGQHVYITKKLIEAAVSLSQDFVDGFCINVVPSSRERKLPLTPKEATIESTIRRMFSSQADQSKFMNRLRFIWDPSELSAVLQKQHSTKTRVHAELLLLDHFDENQLDFLDNNDKYIGCSKPACYLCHAYITHHPGRYAIPSTHQKLYMGWRHPDVDPSATARKAQQEKIMLKLIEWVRRDVTTDLESRTKRLPYHADTAGMSSLSGSIALNALSLHDVDTYTGEPLPQSDASDVSDDDGGVRLDVSRSSPLTT